MQRRHFIAGSIGAVTWAGLASAASDTQAPQATSGYAGLVQQHFNIYDSVRGVTVQLIKVKQVPSASGARQFTLTFAGDHAGALASGTYEVEHPVTGKVAMYLHARATASGMHYRADFNLLP